ncbi:GCK domain-containing protein [Haematococcus lacustris]|uniref:GCK domain-containing protein n=1 Tax=Haematococcus lacustris TaxID=44745 RepID=A0A6A0A418_HAELA|nr:GCK domain-containing protein [Haematococcus lacustris]
MVVEDPPSDIPKEASGKPTCPICAYIEAGPCKQEHQDWTSCRDQAKVEGKDHLDVCQDVCTFDNIDYYEPFHQMLKLGDEDDNDDPHDSDSQDSTATRSHPSQPGLSPFAYATLLRHTLETTVHRIQF